MPRHLKKLCNSIMSDIGFGIQDNKAYVSCAGAKKELPRESLLEIYQLVLGHLAPNRDYSSVTSVRKLLRIITLECEPDESDDESDAEPEPEPEPEPKKPVRARKAPAKGAKKPPAKEPEPEESSEAETSEDSD